MSHPIAERLSVVAAALSSQPADVPRLARLAGFRGVLFDAWSSNLNIPELSRTGRRDFSRMLTAQDQRLVGLRADLGPKGFSPQADVDRQISQLTLAMEAAAGLESPLLCVDLGRLPPPKPQIVQSKPVLPPQAGLIIIPEPQPAPTPSSPTEKPDPAFESQVNAALAQVGIAADRFSTTIVFSASLSSFAALSQVLSAVNCPWFKVDLDPVALLRDEWQADEIFSRFAGLIGHVRARDAIAGSEQRYKPAIIGQGNVDWPKLSATLDEAGYSGFITIDSLELSDRSATATAGAKFLRNLAG